MAADWPLALRRHGAIVEPRHRSTSRHAGGAYRLGDGHSLQPDGHRLASAGREGDFGGSVRLWNVDTLQQVGEPLTDHTGAVMDVVYSPDGHWLAIAGYDNTVRLWNADTGQRVGAPLIGTPTRRFLSFSRWNTVGQRERRRHGAGVGSDANEPSRLPMSWRVWPSVRRSAAGRALADNTVRCGTSTPANPTVPADRAHRCAIRCGVEPDGHRLASAGDTTGAAVERRHRPVCGAPLTGPSWLTSVDSVRTDTGWPPAGPIDGAVVERR